MQKHEIRALKLYHQESLDTLYATLTSKSEFIKAKYNQDDLSDGLRRKLKIEEEHVEICLRYIENVDKLIKAFESEFQMERTKRNFFEKEAKDYMGKYFDVVDMRMDCELIKKAIDKELLKFERK